MSRGYTSGLRGLGLVGVLAAVALLGGCNTYYGPYGVASDSMAPLLRTGDKVMVDESTKARTELHDGDVILLRRDRDIVVLKRILAMPGETIGGRDRKVFRDGRELAEPYLAPSSGEEVPEWMVTFAARKVAPGELFVMGDNRDRSFDSRFERYEPVRLSDVFGKYRYTYWHASVGAK